MLNIRKTICEAAPQAFIVGGALRDSLLKRYSGDIDLALPREAVKPAALKLAKILRASAFEMDPDFCVWRITAKNGLQIDLCAFIGQDINADLKRRDFTVNALAYPVSAPFKIKTKKVGGKLNILISGLKKEDLLDLNNGAQDLKARLIRVNNDKVFIEDPLRLLRACRMAAELNFNVDKRTVELAKKSAPLINKSAGERIQEELKRIFNCPRTRLRLEQLDEAGILTAVFPQLEEQKICAECYYGAGGVFEHTLRVTDRMEFLLSNLALAFPKYHKKLAKFAQDAALYKMAALLHDIAKPATAKEIGGRLRFFYHEEKGAKMAGEVLRNLKYPLAQIRLICKMIEFHLRPSNLASNEIVTDKGIYKFFKEMDEAAIPMLLLCWADYTSYITPAQVKRLIKKSVLPVMTIEEGKKNGNIGKTLRHMQMLNFLFTKYFKETKKFITAPKLLDGRDIMQILKIAPGPQIGRILEQIVIAQVEGKIKTKKDAVNYLLTDKSIL